MALLVLRLQGRMPSEEDAVEDEAADGAALEA
jgi:hypothetical protein